MTPPAKNRPRLPWWIPCALTAVALAAYADSFTGPFVFDDRTAIELSPFVRSLWPLGRAVNAPPQTTSSGRPVLALSFALNYALCGYEVAGYHAVNLLIHIAA